jgi:hypothetical protein
MKTVKQLQQSERMRSKHYSRLTHAGAAMYLDRKVSLSNANETAARANGGKGWVSSTSAKRDEEIVEVVV